MFGPGLTLLARFTCLRVLGWPIGLLVSALVLRYGHGAESLAWVAVFALAPVSGIGCPIGTLPEWLRPPAAALPASHVFEAMRAVMFDGIFRTDRLLRAVAVNACFLTGGTAVFLSVFRLARRRGPLLQRGR